MRYEKTYLIKSKAQTIEKDKKMLTLQKSNLHLFAIKSDDT